MHLKRAEASRKLPIERKGTKYIARASSHYNEGVPVVIAIRDILKLAKNVREVKLMIQNKMLRINWHDVKDSKESLRIFNILEAGDKRYELNLLPTGRFTLEETKKEIRVCKIVNKKILKNKEVQLNFHDGTNVLSKENVSVGDSVELDSSGKIKNVLKLDNGKKVFISSGKSQGKFGKIEEILGRKAVIKFDDRSVELDKNHFIVVK